MSYGIEIPLKAISTNEIIELDINTNTRKGCSLIPAKYFLMKQRRKNEDKEEELVFYAAKYDSLPKSLVDDSIDLNKFPTNPPDRIGRAICTHGKIDHVHVTDQFRGCSNSVFCSLYVGYSNYFKYTEIFVTRTHVGKQGFKTSQTLPEE